MANKKIEFSAKNVKAFSAWLKKFSSIDTALLLEIDEPGSRFLAKTYNEARSVVKFSTIKFDEAGFTVTPSKEPKRIKVGLFNITRLMKIMDQFNDAEFSFTVNYDEVIQDDNSSEWAGISLLLKNKNLKMTVDCTSLNIFKYISDDLFKERISALDEILAKFHFSKGNIEQTNQLCSLDSEYKFMEFKNGANVYVSGQSFELLIGQNPSSEEIKEKTLNIFKQQFESIDLENYHVEMGEDRLVFTSDDESTITVVSMVEKD